MIKVGIKYCGGCNPTYDRVAAVKEMEERLRSRAELISWHDESADAVVIVAGCAASCVDGEPFAGRPLWRINRPEDIDSVLKELEGKAAEKG